MDQWKENAFTCFGLTKNRNRFFFLLLVPHPDPLQTGSLIVQLLWVLAAHMLPTGSPFLWGTALHPPCPVYSLSPSLGSRWSAETWMPIVWCDSGSRVPHGIRLKLDFCWNTVLLSSFPSLTLLTSVPFFREFFPNKSWASNWLSQTLLLGHLACLSG